MTDVRQISNPGGPFDGLPSWTLHILVRPKMSAWPYFPYKIWQKWQTTIGIYFVGLLRLLIDNQIHTTLISVLVREMPSSWTVLDITCLLGHKPSRFIAYESKHKNNSYQWQNDNQSPVVHLLALDPCWLVTFKFAYFCGSIWWQNGIQSPVVCLLAAAETFVAKNAHIDSMFSKAEERLHSLLEQLLF